MYILYFCICTLNHPCHQTNKTTNHTPPSAFNIKPTVSAGWNHPPINSHRVVLWSIFISPCRVRPHTLGIPRQLTATHDEFVDGSHIYYTYWVGWISLFVWVLCSNLCAWSIMNSDWNVFVFFCVLIHISLKYGKFFSIWKFARAKNLLSFFFLYISEIVCKPGAQKKN